MKISGFTIARNAVKFNYPLVESIQSILPVCDEFIVNVGDSSDNTLELVRSINSDKIRIIQNKWDFTQGKEVLAFQTNLALKECQGDWAFYLQSDEVIHQDDLGLLKRLMLRYIDEDVDALRFRWLHFYGSYFRYRIDKGWYQKQDRIIRNNGTVESFGDAFGFKRRDGQPLKRKNTACLLYHYGWVQEGDLMRQRRINAENIGFVSLDDAERNQRYAYGDLTRFHPYFGTHPNVMRIKILRHLTSQEDKKAIAQKYWWHPLKILRVRYKTGKRVKKSLNFKNSSSQKILLINIFGIGDVLFTMPLIYNLKKAFPDVSIGYVCNRRTVSVLESSSDVDQVFIYERDEFNALYKKSKTQFLKYGQAFLRDIKREQYDMVIDVSLNGWVSFFCWLAGIKTRIGFNYKKRSMFLTKKIPFKGYEDKHVVEYYLGLLEVLGIPVKEQEMRLVVNSNDVDWATQFLTMNEIKEKGVLIGIVPGGGASWGKDAGYKRWSTAKYAKLADNLIEKFSASIILMGSLGETDLCDEVSQVMRGSSYSACGKTNIGQFAALAKRCAIVIVNDGGPLHMAVAAGARTVSIFGPVDEHVYGPYPVDVGRHQVVSASVACRPCYRRFRRASCEHISCLNQIKVENVLEKIKEILK